MLIVNSKKTLRWIIYIITVEITILCLEFKYLDLK